MGVCVTLKSFSGNPYSLIDNSGSTGSTKPSGPIEPVSKESIVFTSLNSTDSNLTLDKFVLVKSTFVNVYEQLNKLYDEEKYDTYDKFVNKILESDKDVNNIKKKVKDVIKDFAGKDKIIIKDFIRYKVGEGI